MNDQDLRDCFAMFSMMGIIIGRNVESMAQVAELSYMQADAMLEARKPAEEGIVAIKRKVKAK